MTASPNLCPAAAKISRFRLAGLFVLIFATVLAMTPSANAAGITYDPITGQWTVYLSISCDWFGCTIDPENVDAFSLSAKFDPSVLTFNSITYDAPYVETTAPNLSQIANGYIYNIAGSVATGDVPPAGDVDLFAINYTATVPGTTPIGITTVFASTGDFVDAIDPDTGDIIHIGPSGIIGATCTPEPSSLYLLGSGLLGLAGVMRRKFCRN